MQTDITLSSKDKHQVLIIDAKYYGHTTQKQFGAHTLHSGNLYQIFTYVKNKEYELRNTDHTVAGMLLYAKTDEDTVEVTSANAHDITVTSKLIRPDDEVVYGDSGHIGLLRSNTLLQIS